MRIRLRVALLTGFLTSSVANTQQAGTAHVDGFVSPSTQKRLIAAAPRSQPLHAPLLGYTATSSGQSVRAIYGIPGATYLGDAIHLGEPLTALAVCSSRSYFLAAGGKTGQTWLTKLSPDERRVLLRTPVHLDFTPDQIVLSPSGNLAGLYDRQSRSIHFLAGLPGAPRVLGVVTLSALPALVTRFAVSDVSFVATAVFSQSGRDEIYVLEPEKPPRSLAAAAEVSHLSFIPGTRDVLFADRRSDQIFWISDVAGHADVRTLAGPEAGIAGPIAVEASLDRGSIFVVNAVSNTLITLDTSGRRFATDAAFLRLTSLVRLRDADSFQLAAVDQGPVPIFQSSGANSGIFLVPAPGAQPTLPKLAPPRQRFHR
jgi:hypothetical protein